MNNGGKTRYHVTEAAVSDKHKDNYQLTLPFSSALRALYHLSAYCIGLPACSLTVLVQLSHQPHFFEQ